MNGVRGRSAGWPFRHISVAAIVGSFALACGYEVHNDESSDGCPAGSAGCPCAEDGECEGALECVGGVCQSGPVGSTTSLSAITGSSSIGAGTNGSTSTSETGDSSSGVGTGETAGCEFICDADEPMGTQRCDVFAQDCPEGQKCSAYDMNDDGVLGSTTCFEVAGDGQHGDPCTIQVGVGAIDDCAAGVMCWFVDDEGAGVCIELCTGTPENPACAPPNTQCVLCGGCVINLCIPGCDPLIQDCMAGELCIGDPNSDNFVCVLDDSGGMSPEGTSCEFANVCNPGLMCVSPEFYPNPACEEALGCCAPFCDLDDGDEGCQDLSVIDAVCVPYHDPGEAPPGLENVGVCGVMP